MNWSEGYFTGVNYTYGYYRQLNPAELRLAVLASGFAPPPGDGRNYLELGFGQGISFSFHAAANGCSYWGTDFNAAHAANAMELAAAAGAHTHVFDDSFREFAARDDLPEFDYIVLHGIWSWVSDENRDIIVELIRRRLKTGGIAYVSYNVHPGWAAGIPIRQLMSLFKDRVGAIAGPEETVSGSLRFAKEVLEAGGEYYRDIPAIGRHLETLSALEAHDASYIAHEYLNADWKISMFSETATHLGQAKLGYAGTTRLLDNIELLRFTPEGQKIIGQIGDPLLRETAKDFLSNQRFRCDVYVKGARRIPHSEFVRQWFAQLFVLTTHTSELPEKVLLPLGSVQLNENVPAAIVAALAENDYAPKTLTQIHQQPGLAAARSEELINAMLLLVGAGHASTAQQPSAEIVARCRSLNRYVCDRALVIRDVECLASPVTGGAITVSHLGLLFIKAVEQGSRTVQELARYVWAFLQSIGEKLRKDGKAIESPEDNLAGIQALAERFMASKWPMLKALQVI